MKVQYLTTRILVIDDDRDDFWIISDYIKSISNNKFTVDWSYTYEDGLGKLMRREYDLYLVDYRLGAKTGIDFLKEASIAETGDPVILLTGKGNYDIDVLSMQLGAADYLVKTELSTEKIERSIRYAIGRSTTLKEIKAKEAKFRNLFENSKDVIFVTDENLHVLEINAAIETLLGYTRPEIISKNLNELFHITNGTKQTLNPGVEIIDIEVEAVTKSGEPKICTLTLNFEFHEVMTGNMQGILHDITNLKLIEKSRIQTEKLAATGRLLRTIAHEVRNQINNISLAATQLTAELVDPHTSDYLQIIQRNTKRINDLISELLNTSKPASGIFEDILLQDVLEDVIAAASDRIKLLHIRFSKIIPAERWKIKADRNSLKLALQNIIMNAIEAIDHQAGTIEIALRRESGLYAVTISDNGCGIPKEELGRLFEPFFTRKKNGLGLGLTYSMNILRAHQVHTDVQSVPGTGTTFKLTFQGVE